VPHLPLWPVQAVLPSIMINYQLTAMSAQNSRQNLSAPIFNVLNSLGKNGGETGIRTLETVTRLHTFQACAFDHSATSPHAK
jgi:hypothetical protein